MFVVAVQADARPRVHAGARRRIRSATTRDVFDASLEHGLRNPPVRWVMLAAPFTAGVGIYTFYALQPYLLELWGDPEGVLDRRARGGDRRRRADRRRLCWRRGSAPLFRKRTTALILGDGRERRDPRRCSA